MICAMLIKWLCFPAGYCMTPERLPKIILQAENPEVFMIIQLGISLITPIFICIAVCWWLTEQFGLDSWIYIPGILFGLGAGAVTAWKFYRSVMNRQQKKKDHHPVSFNLHL